MQILHALRNQELKTRSGVQKNFCNAETLMAVKYIDLNDRKRT